MVPGVVPHRFLFGVAAPFAWDIAARQPLTPLCHGHIVAKELSPHARRWARGRVQRNR